MSRPTLRAAMAAGDAAAIAGAALLAWGLYHPAVDLRANLLLGLTVTALFVASSLARGDYDVCRHTSMAGLVKRSLNPWCVAVLCTLVIAFLTKTSDELSRIATVIFFTMGLAGTAAMRTALVRITANWLRTADIASRQIFLVGDETMIRAFTERHDTEGTGLRLLGATVLRSDAACLAEDLALAAASARVLRPDDIYIMVPWTDRQTLEACIDTFMGLPAAIHLAPERFFDRFNDLDVVRTGSVASLHLVKRPLSRVDVAVKRMVDILVAGTALVCLAPVFVAVAVAIKLDSAGPVMFLQRRYGFNQEPFRIMKFRSMRTLEDSRVVRQATRNDPRITAVGRFIRRTNIDELPQLINVLKGDMSLVGPRPHAMAHDQAFEREIALYARRHNVKPGITGWAQVNGWRGETDTADKIRGRVEHDLHYIDNWSLLLDLSILFRTAFSKTAYKNAR